MRNDERKQRLTAYQKGQHVIGNIIIKKINPGLL
jgi:hypothetical protein